MKTDFNKHLYGIFRTIQSRFDLINRSIGHSATQGSENEKEIKKLLEDFLPSNYGIGDGVIIDIDGNESKQNDIIIYDKSLPNYSLGSDSKIFLVDCVIATIEIKTTFSTGKNSSLNSAVENVKFIKKLKPSNKKWIEPKNDEDDTGMPLFSFNEFTGQVPISIVFFYSIPETKTAIDLNHFRDSIKLSLSETPKHLHPDLIFSMAHSAFFWYDDIAKITEGKFNFYPLNISDVPNNPVIFPFIDSSFKALHLFGSVSIIDGSSLNYKIINESNGNSKILILEGDNINSENLVYRTCKLDDKILFLDSYRAFIGFIAQIDALIRLKKTNKSLFLTDYFHGTFFSAARFDDGLKLK